MEYLKNRVMVHYGRLVTDDANWNVPISEIQVRATMAANRDLILRFNMTAVELMEFILDKG